MYSRNTIPRKPLCKDDSSQIPKSLTKVEQSPSTATHAYDTNSALPSVVSLSTTIQVVLKYTSSSSLSPNINTPSSQGVTSSRANQENNSSGAYSESPLASHPPSTNSTQPTALDTNGTATRNVEWGIHWKTPGLIVAMLFFGLAFSIAHHIHYSSLNRTPAGTKSKQQWSTAFGTGYAFLVIALLRTACTEAYEQYIWMLCKRKSFDLATLDKLFALTSSPAGFWSWRIFKNATVAVAIALICWCMALAGLTPPATLTIVYGYRNETIPLFFPTMDWRESDYSSLLYVAVTSARQARILNPAFLPARNVSFGASFYGPSIKCSNANSTQEVIFRDYETYLVDNDDYYKIWTERTFKEGRPGIYAKDRNRPAPPLMLQVAIFAPFAWRERYDPYGNSKYEGEKFSKYSSDQSWVVPDRFFEENYRNGTSALYDVSSGEYKEVPCASYVPQLWVQTANESLVCLLGNTSFDVRFEFVNGIQRTVQYSTHAFEPLWTPSYYRSSCYNPEYMFSLEEDLELLNYGKLFDIFSTLLWGNNTMSLYGDSLGTMSAVEDFYDIYSDIRYTDLWNCKDFTQSYWIANLIGMSRDTVVPWQLSENYNETDGTWSPTFSNITSLYPDVTQRCRNVTLRYGIEDMINNISISMLSLEESLTKENVTVSNVTYFDTYNMYQYDARNLLTSYGIAILFTIVVVCVGFYSLHQNGVAHSTSFSALISTTRNSRLDELVKGHSLGALPLDRRVGSVKIRFGELYEGDGDRGAGETHLGFGFTENVKRIRKGGSYI